MAGINKEIWLPEIMEGFYADDMFLSEARDFSAFVEYDKLNLAEAGINPRVFINNTTYPVPIAERGDTPISIELDYYDTENTVIRNADKIELAYDKRASVLFGHQMALKMLLMEKAIHAFAPASNSIYTPSISTTGETVNGVKKISWEDILTLESEFDEAEIPSEGRILVLNTQHKKDLKAEDLKLYKEIFNKKEDFSGFKFHSLAKKRMPKFNKNTGAKIAFGAAASANDTHVSVAFQKNEVFRADGSVDIFFTEKDNAARGDLFGLQKRALAGSIRGKGIGAIYSGV